MYSVLEKGSLVRTKAIEAYSPIKTRLEYKAEIKTVQEGDSDINFNNKRNECTDVRHTKPVGGQQQLMYLVLPEAEVARAPLKMSKNLQEGVIDQNMEQEWSSDGSSLGPRTSRKQQVDIIQDGLKQAGMKDESCDIDSCITKEQTQPLHHLEKEQISDDDDDGHQFDGSGWQIFSDVKSIEHAGRFHSIKEEENVSESKQPTSDSKGERDHESLEDMEKLPSVNTCTSIEREDKLKEHQHKKYQMTTEINANRSCTGDGKEISATIQSLSGTTGEKPRENCEKRSASGTRGEREVKLIALNDKLTALVVKQHLEGKVPLQDVGKLASTIAKSPSGDQDLNCVDNTTMKVPDENDSVSTTSRNKTLELIYKCHKCHSYFDTLHQLLEHMHGRNGKCLKIKCVAEELQCKECGKCCSRRNMPRHMISHTGERPFVCEVCGKGFTMKDYLTKHVMRMHMEEKPCVCQYCGKGFINMYLLNQHITIHTGEMMYRCQECDKAIRNYSGYIHHLKTHRHRVDRRYTCSMCDKRFLMKESCKKHENVCLHRRITHSVDLTCKQCGRKCASLTGLRLHAKVHEPKEVRTASSVRKCMPPSKDQKPTILCQICGKLFKTQGHLDSHLLIHSDVKGFKCDICNKAFRHHLSLKFHKRIHAGDRPYVCAICKYAFFTVTCLKSHERTHRGTNLFKCPQCDISFSNKYSLNLHSETHAKTKSHDCHLCKSTFIAKRLLESHLFRFHREEVKSADTRTRKAQELKKEDSTKIHGDVNSVKQALRFQSPKEEKNVSESKRPTSDSKGEQDCESLEDMEKLPSVNTCTSIKPEDKLNGHQHKKYQMTTEINANRSCTGDGKEISATIQALSGTTGGKPRDSCLKRSASSTRGEQEVKLIVCKDKLTALVVKQHLEGKVPLQNVGKLASTKAKTPSGDQDLNCVDNSTVKVPDKNDGISTASRNKTLELINKCHKCHSYFDTPHQLLEHKHGRNGKCRKSKCVAGELQCKECGKCCSRRNMPRHMISHTGERPFVCEYCGKGFTMKDYLTKHVMRMHMEEKPCVCQYCGKGFINMYLLNQHITIHTGEMMYRCQECDKAIRNYSGYIQHLKTHKIDRRYTCSTCDKRYLSKESCKKHEKVCLQSRTTQSVDLTCKQCGRKCASLTGLRLHAKVHESKEARMASSVLKGMPPSKDLKPTILCQICGKLFKTQGHLDSHLLIHSDVKGFKCDICNKAFRHRLSLKFHKQIHAGDRPYVCAICKYAFFTVTCLKSHERTHRGTKLFKCPQCDISFSNKYSLNLHSETHAKTKSHDCHLCKSTFIAKRLLESHLFRFHRVEVKSADTRTGKVQEPMKEDSVKVNVEPPIRKKVIK